MTRDEFTEEMDWFCKYYERPPLNETMFGAWFCLSHEYSKKDFILALKEHVRTDEFPTFPAYGKIYQQLIKIRRPIQ